MTLQIEGVVDCGVGGDEALTLGLETLHLALASSDRKVRVFNPVVLAQSARTVSVPTAKNLQCRFVRSKAIGDNFVRYALLVLEQLPEQFQRSNLVPTPLYQHVEDITFLVHSPPHVQALAIDADHHFVEMPDTVGTAANFANVGCNRRTELVRPAADSSVAHIDAPLREQILDIAQARRETKI